MRKVEISVNNRRGYLGQADISYPDDVVFVFNPIYLEWNAGTHGGEYKYDKMQVEVEASRGNKDRYTLDIQLYKGHARIYLSRILELLFTDVRRERSMNATIRVKIDSDTVWLITLTAIWANLAVGERFSYYGAFKLDHDKPYLHRKRIWFRNYPYLLSMFAHINYSQDRNIDVRQDDEQYRRTPFAYFPPLYAVINSIEDEEIIAWHTVADDGIEDATTEGDRLEGGVLDLQEGRFWGGSDELELWEHWTDGPASGCPGESYYNRNGKARTDMVWGYRGKLVRWDEANRRLEEIPYGRPGYNGIFEVDPAFTFPDAQHNVLYKQAGKQASQKFSVFDNTFDYTFFTSGAYTTLTELIIDHSTTGHYLRWIDRLGMYQYFLFTKGKQTLKSKLGSSTVQEDYDVSGMYFANHERTTHIEGTTTYKCCAVGLEEDIYAYVSSVITSPIIDLYMGKNLDGVEMWVPVNITARSHDYEPTEQKHDLEIEITLPPFNSQTL